MIVSSIRFTAIIFLLMLYRPSFTLFAIKAIRFVLVDGAFNAINCCVLHLAFMGTVVRECPNVRAQLAVVIRFRHCSLSTYVVVRGDDLGAVFVIVHQILIGQGAVFNVRSFCRYREQAVSSSGEGVEGKFVLCTVRFFRTNVYPGRLLDSILIRMYGARLSLSEVFQVQVNNYAGNVVTGMVWSMSIVFYGICYFRDYVNDCFVFLFAVYLERRWNTIVINGIAMVFQISVR